VKEGDPIDALRAAWQGLEPGAADARDQLGEHAVERLREAWRGLEAPAPRVPTRPRRAWRWIAAAALAAGLLAWALAETPRKPTTRAPDSVTVALLAPRAEFSTPPLSALSNTSMELRSGNVRLLLFLPTSSSSNHKQANPKEAR
jgi:hypothetical protein